MESYPSYFEPVHIRELSKDPAAKRLLNPLHNHHYELVVDDAGTVFGDSLDYYAQRFTRSSA